LGLVTAIAIFCRISTKRCTSSTMRVFFSRAQEMVHTHVKINNGGTRQVHEHCIATHLNLPNLKRPTYHIMNRQQ
jgi:hypothetical protein